MYLIKDGMVKIDKMWPHMPHQPKTYEKTALKRYKIGDFAQFWTSKDV
jgi:adenine/guanine phosphoribosyltransferase-like PRPP-binding protein